MRERPTILLVDDDVDTREMYAWSLESRGFAVITAGSVPHAAAIAADRQPDAIVTDFTLPGADGLDLARQVRGSSSLASTPMVLVSGRAFVGDSGVRAMELFDRVLLKPVLPDQLIGELVPLMLDKTAAALQRQLRDVRERIAAIPSGSNAGRVMAAVEQATAARTPAALLADSGACYIDANPEACALTGRSRDELLSLHVWDLTSQIAADAVRQQWEQFVRSGAQAGAYSIQGPAGLPIRASFAAFANILPDCHLALLQPLPQALVREGT